MAVNTLIIENNWLNGGSKSSQLCYQLFDNIENPIFPIRSIISNVKKAEKYLPLHYGYKGVVETNVFLLQFFSK